MKNIPPLHLACSKDELRPVMQCVFISKGKGVATNGHILIKCQLDHEIQPEVLEKMEGMLIHWRTWQFICSNSCSQIIFEGTGLLLITNIGKVRLESWTQEQFPEYGKAIPEGKRFDGLKNVGISPSLLITVAKIMGAPNGVCLDFFNEGKGIAVTPVEGLIWTGLKWNSEALLMPLQIGDKDLKPEPFTFLKS